MSHDCIFESQRDMFSVRPMLLQRCRCHTDRWETRSPDEDPPYRCPVTHQSPPRQEQS